MPCFLPYGDQINLWHDICFCPDAGFSIITMEQKMKQYSERTDHWMKHKALGYFINFINHHNDSIQDDDTFSLVGDLICQSEWLTRIQKTFTAKELLDFQNAKCRRNRLDFEETPQEILCAIWGLLTIPGRRRYYFDAGNRVVFSYGTAFCPGT